MLIFILAGKYPDPPMLYIFCIILLSSLNSGNGGKKYIVKTVGGDEGVRTTKRTTMSITKLFEDFWSWRLKQSPEFATMTGSKKYNDVLETFTEERFKNDFKSCKKLLKEQITS